MNLYLYSKQKLNNLILYTLEKLDLNKETIIKFLSNNNINISLNNDINTSNTKQYNNIYIKCKDNIVYEKNYINKMLDTDIMNFFYNEEIINKFYTKYKYK